MEPRTYSLEQIEYLEARAAQIKARAAFYEADAVAFNDLESGKIDFEDYVIATGDAEEAARAADRALAAAEDRLVAWALNEVKRAAPALYRLHGADIEEVKRGAAKSGAVRARVVRLSLEFAPQ